MAAHHLSLLEGRQPYNEAIYMQSLHRRGSLLAGFLGQSTGVGWKSVAGFQKFSENNA
jgi:hypothetical protein